MDRNDREREVDEFFLAELPPSALVDFVRYATVGDARDRLGPFGRGARALLGFARARAACSLQSTRAPKRINTMQRTCPRSI